MNSERTQFPAEWNAQGFVANELATRLVQRAVPFLEQLNTPRFSGADVLGSPEAIRLQGEHATGRFEMRTRQVAFGFFTPSIWVPTFLSRSGWGWIVRSTAVGDIATRRALTWEVFLYHRIFLLNNYRIARVPVATEPELFRSALEVLQANEQRCLQMITE